MMSLKEKLSEIDGGVAAIANACGVSVRAVYKWMSNDRLPRTEYTGETSYAAAIAELPGASFKARDLLYFDRAA